MSAQRDLKILIVDDDPRVRRALARLIQLEFAHAVVDAAGDADTALRRVAAEPWDLVLLDVSMPGKSGLEALREMRSRNLLVPVVMMSGHAADDYAAAAIAAGAFAYLQKEWIARDLSTVVGSALADHHAGGRT